MNRLARITALSASIDTTLNEFALAVNAQGEYPWQQAQRERRNRRMAGAAVGAAAIGAGAYGAKKGMGALNQRYGTTGSDGLKAGAADLVNRADDAVKAGVSRVKTAAAPMIDKAKGLAAPVVDPLKRKVAAGKLSYGRGVAQKQGAGKLIGRVARAVIHASRADQIIALEAKMDEALVEFGMKEDEKKSWPKNRVGLPAGSIAAGVAAYGADKAIMNRAKKKYGFTPTRATAYGEGVTDAMKSGKRMMKRGVVQAKYHAEPVVRKIKGALGMRKVAGMLK